MASRRIGVLPVASAVRGPFPEDLQHLDDDKAGRAVDELFASDRASLANPTTAVVHLPIPAPPASVSKRQPAIPMRKS